MSCVVELVLDISRRYYREYGIDPYVIYISPLLRKEAIDIIEALKGKYLFTADQNVYGNSCYICGHKVELDNNLKGYSTKVYHPSYYTTHGHNPL